ncbi:MAG: M24 family metallopeptidase [Candidatus Gastranaerophilales bacterium]|nr:M24 family metallopeptidase [Candidatus Gastranaerophilales bacterium]MCM1072819.1 M24 family metallopeptidase [Bacteroides sp.]
MHRGKVNQILDKLKIDYLLVNSTNEYLVEYSSLSENARYTLTGFSGSTGDALITSDNIYLFVDGRYHTQADLEAKKGVTVVKLELGQKQDEEVRKLINPKKTLGIVAKKVSQARLEGFKGYKIKLLEEDPINNFTEPHQEPHDKTNCKPKLFTPQKPVFISNLEEVSYLTGYRDFSKDCSSKIWAKLVINNDDMLLFTDNKACETYLKNFEGQLVVDKHSINAWDYSLIKQPVYNPSGVKFLKSVKTDEEIEAYKQAFEKTDRAVNAIRDYIEANDTLSEYDIAKQLREEFIRYGAKSLSFNSIVAVNQNSALAHYSKNAKDVILKEGDLVLIDCGAYYESGLATDITRVFVKGNPSELQKQVYTTVLKAFLNAYNLNAKTGFEHDELAHKILDGAIEGFTFSHGLGHGIGINVHEAPPALNQSEIAHTEIKDNMCFTIEPGLYNPKYFGVRLENSCYRKNGKNCSFVKMGYEGKLIDYSLLTAQEKEWLKEFEVL